MLPPIKHSVYIAAAPQRVFETLTTASGWNAWFTRGTTLDLHPGGNLDLRWENWGPEHVTTVDHAVVLEISPEHKFSFKWNLDSDPTIVTFEMEEHAGGTILRVTDEGYQSLDVFLGCATGWAEALTLLKMFLEHGLTYGIVP